MEKQTVAGRGARDAGVMAEVNRSVDTTIKARPSTVFHVKHHQLPRRARALAATCHHAAASHACCPTAYPLWHRDLCGQLADKSPQRRSDALVRILCTEGTNHGFHAPPALLPVPDAARPGNHQGFAERWTTMARRMRPRGRSR
jgi:hypothetical protein